MMKTSIVVLCLAIASCMPSTATHQGSFFQKKAGKRKIVIFYHGIFGDARTTWGKTDKAWPMLISSDPQFEDFDVFVVDYDSPYLSKTSNIEEVSVAKKQELQTKGILRDYDQVHIIAHSMGGIIAQRICVLLRAETTPDYSKIKSITLLSTPSHGATIAYLTSWLSSNPQLKDLKSSDMNTLLQAYYNSWKLLADSRVKSGLLQPRINVLYETKPMITIKIVERTYTLTAFDGLPIALDRNHIDMAKPDGYEDRLYETVRSFIQEAVEPPEEEVGMFIVEGMSFDDAVNGILRGTGFAPRYISCDTIKNKKIVAGELKARSIERFIALLGQRLIGSNRIQLKIQKNQEQSLYDISCDEN
ncbi:alpha/beta hydrolase [bacterium]|nr:alpha/beta hydrolase [bacterium]NUN47031.1 hypothetical protein [bacterium]